MANRNIYWLLKLFWGYRQVTKTNQVTTGHATASECPRTQAEYEFLNSKSLRFWTNSFHFAVAQAQPATAAQLMSSLSWANPGNCAVQRYPDFMPLFLLVEFTLEFCIRSGVWNIGDVKRANLFMNMERNWVNLIHWLKEKRDQRTVIIKPHYESTHESHRFALLLYKDFLS